MDMPAAPTDWTVDMLDALEDDGQLRPSSLARVLQSPADVRKPDRKRNRVQPDVFVVRLTDGKRPEYPYRLSDLILAVEVESPSNPGLDYHIKRDLYLRNGIAEYWVVNPVAHNSEAGLGDLGRH